MHMPYARDSERAPLCFLTIVLPHPCPPVPPHRHVVGSLSAAQRFRASAGGVGRSILLAGVVVWISVVGLLAWPWLRGWISLFQLGPDQNAYAQISEVCSLHPPSSLYPAPQWDGCKGGWKGSGIVVITVLLLQRPASPSLTLANAPLAREHWGPPIPGQHWLPCWVRCTGAPGDKAAQGWGLGPQLGALRRSPSTCRPVLDTVYASFCREYLNTCSERPRTCP